jgi:malate dehydrogenase (oxaloacetate-decarboxylating)(NADP+)
LFVVHPVTFLALAECLTTEDAARGQVFPHISKIRSVSHAVAVAVIEEAIRTGLNTKVQLEDETLYDYVNRKMYYPEYVPLIEKRTISI